MPGAGGPVGDMGMFPEDELAFESGLYVVEYFCGSGVNGQ
jgi:hypothetical protein